jgi:hypothetical protein
MKETQRREGIRVRWDVGLNKKKLAYFYFPQVCVYERCVCVCACVVHVFVRVFVRAHAWQRQLH